MAWIIDCQQIWHWVSDYRVPWYLPWYTCSYWYLTLISGLTSWEKNGSIKSNWISDHFCNMVHLLTCCCFGLAVKRNIRSFESLWSSCLLIHGFQVGLSNVSSLNPSSLRHGCSYPHELSIFSSPSLLPFHPYQWSYQCIYEYSLAGLKKCLMLRTSKVIEDIKQSVIIECSCSKVPLYISINRQ